MSVNVEGGDVFSGWTLERDCDVLLGIWIGPSLVPTFLSTINLLESGLTGRNLTCTYYLAGVQRTVAEPKFLVSCWVYVTMACSASDVLAPSFVKAM